MANAQVKEFRLKKVVLKLKKQEAKDLIYCLERYKNYSYTHISFIKKLVNILDSAVDNFN